jgi:hypothetical protein
MPFVAGG